MNILIIKIGAIGDVVMSLSMVTAIHALYPNAKITWVVGKTAAPILSIIDGINEVVIVDDKKLLKGSFLSKIATLIGIWLKIFNKKFDLVINGHSDARYKYLSLPHFFSPYRSFSNSRKQRKMPVPSRHHTHEYARLVIGCDTYIENNYQLPIPDLSSVVLPKTDEIDTSNKVIAISPGGAKNLMRDDELRRWTIQNFVTLSNQLINAGYQVVLIGALSDEWILPYFKHTTVKNLLGRFDLPQLVLFLQGADLMITHDSGPLHLSGLARCKVIALFGPTNPHEKVPTTQKNIILWGGENLPCRPCYDGKEFATCTNNLCMQQIAVDQVFNSAISMLKINEQ